MMPTTAPHWETGRGVLLVCAWVGVLAAGCKHARPGGSPGETHSMVARESDEAAEARNYDGMAKEVTEPTGRGRTKAIDLEWVPGGLNLSIGEGLWVLQPDTGSLGQFNCSSSDGLLPSTSCTRSHIAWSPGGRKALVLEGQALFLGRSQGPFGNRVPIPTWVALSSSDDSSVHHFAFWLSEREAFVQQELHPLVGEPACGVYDVRSGEWRREARECLRGSYSQIGAVQKGPDSLLAIYSGAEGMGMLEIVRYDAAHGQQKTGIPSVELSATPATVRFEPMASRVDVVTPCQVGSLGGAAAEENRCDESKPWGLFSAPTSGGSFKLQRSDLPPGTVMDPKHDRFAWPRGNEVCIGDPREPKPRCYALPAFAPGGKP